MIFPSSNSYILSTILPSKLHFICSLFLYLSKKNTIKSNTNKQEKIKTQKLLLGMGNVVDIPRDTQLDQTIFILPEGINCK